jgi:NAD(P) transhydrogenase subunit alpha
MIIGVPKESRPGEERVAASPETVKKLIDLGFQVTVQKGAGDGASMPDDAFKEAGAAIGTSAKSVLGKADIVFKVQRPTAEEIKSMKAGALLVCLLAPFEDPATAKACADAKVNAVALELIPRITRAQTMDVLSSQANLAGYRAVIDAAAEFGRAMPQFMTAAGTIRPAKVFVMGAGVAGLQAIATARRLGGQVTATDVRRAAAEQVESLGAKFVMVETEEDMETEGGYAKELSKEDQKRQAELVAEHIKNQDIVITTALIPGRPAPRLIDKKMVQSMKPGSVIVDLAVSNGGNVAGSEADKVAEVGGVKIIGYTNVPSRVPEDASALFARNLVNFVTPLVDQESKEFKVDWEDEIVAASTVTRDGAIVNQAVAEAAGKSAPKSKSS